jgi:hypothetical protein
MTSRQATISHVFAKAKATSAPEKRKDLPVEKKLVSTDPLVQAFYDQLTPQETIAHLIAVEKLGTSYDVIRTHGYLRWAKTRAA